MKIPSEAQWQRNTPFIPHLNTHLSIWGGAGFDRWVYKANSTQREQEREREIDWGKRHQRDTQSWDGVTYWATEACQLSNHKAEDGQQQTCAAKMPDHTTKRRPVPSWSDFFLPQPGQPVEIRLLTCNASTNYNRPGSRSKKFHCNPLDLDLSHASAMVLCNYETTMVQQSFSIVFMVSGPFDIQFCMRKLHLPGLNYIYFSWMSAWSSSVLTGDDWPRNSQTATRPIYPPETAAPSYGPTAPVRSTS